MNSQLRHKPGHRISDDWFGLLADTMDEGLIIEDENSQIIFVNQRLCNMLGYSSDEMLAHETIEFVDEAGCRILDEQKVEWRQGKTGNYEITFVTKDGQRIVAQMSTRALFSPEGRPKGAMTTITDITPRKRAEEDMLSLSGAMDHSSGATLITDRLGVIKYVNRKFTELTGYDADEVIGKTPSILKSGNTSADQYQRLWETILGSGEWRGEIQDKRKNGELYWAYEIIRPIRNEKGEVTHYIALQEDITEYRHIKEMLEMSQQKYYALVENSLIGIYFVQDDNIVYCNAKLAEIFGYSINEMLGMKVSSLFEMEFPLGMTDGGDMRSAEEGKVSQYKVKGVKRGGEIIWLKLCLSSVDYQGVSSTLGYLVDITPEKAMEDIIWSSERELRILSARLLDAQEEERKRIARELHDSVGQCLYTIKFSLDDLADVVHGDQDTSWLRSLKAFSPMIQEAINEVRRISMDLHPPLLEDLGLLATIDWYCAKFQAIYAVIHIEKHIEIKEENIPNSLRTVIYRVLQEALINVAKHANAYHVELALKKDAHSIEMTIKDNGRGFNLGDVISGECSKRGLGLASMRERTQLAGGVFFIDSARGIGTVIRATWPC